MPRTLSLSYRLADAFRRHLGIFVLGSLTVTGVALGLMFTRAKTYAATASTRVNPNTEAAASVGVTIPSSSWLTPAQQNVERFQDFLNDDKRGGFLDVALRKADLVRPINIDVNAHDARFDKFKRNLRVQAASGNMFNITLVWDNPGECARIVSALQQQYIETVSETKRAGSQAIEQFLDTQIDRYARHMRRAEKILVEYKQSHYGRLPDAQTRDLEQLGVLRGQLDEMEIRSRDSELKRSALEQRLAQIPPVLISEQVFGEDPVRKQLNALEVERRILAVNFKPESTEVTELDSKIGALKKILAERGKRASGDLSQVVESKKRPNPEYVDLKRELTTARISESTLNAQIRLTKGRMNDYVVRVKLIPKSETQLTDKTRDYTIYKTQYEQLLERREQARIKGNLDKVSARSEFTSIGDISAEPTAKRLKMLLLGLGACLLGPFFGFLLVVAREWMDPSLRYEEDVERLLGAPALASIPDSPRLCLPGVERAN